MAKKRIYKPIIEKNELDLVTGLEFLNGNKTEIISEVEIIDHPPCEAEANEAAAALGIKDKQEDLLYVKFKMVHADVNKNKDQFLKEQLVLAEKTPILKLIDWAHKEPNIGVIYQSRYVDGQDGEKDYLECLGAILKYKYPEYAKQILQRHSDKKLYFSMEVWFKEAQCSVCDSVFTEGEASYCEHLKNRYADASSTSRILKGLTFAGAGIVESPADILAESLAIASTSTKEKENIVEISKANKENEEALNVDMFTKEQVDQMVKDAVEQAVASLQTENETKIKELSERVAALEGDNKTLSEAKVDFESKYGQVVAEFESYKQDVNAEKTAVVRMLELASIGFEVPNMLSDEKAYSELLGKLKKMDDGSFALMKELTVKVIEKKSEASVSTEKKEEKKENEEVPTTPLVEASTKPTDKIQSLVHKLYSN